MTARYFLLFSLWLPAELAEDKPPIKGTPSAAGRHGGFASRDRAGGHPARITARAQI
jgi:hypothetical protein